MDDYADYPLSRLKRGLFRIFYGKSIHDICEWTELEIREVTDTFGLFCDWVLVNEDGSPDLEDDESSNQQNAADAEKPGAADF